MLLATYQPDIRSIDGSLTASALIAALPLATLFFMLGVLRITAWISGLAALVVAVFVATVGFDMPFDQAAAVSSWGAAFGFFPIMWIVISAIWVYNMTVATGHFDVLRRSFAAVSDDMRVQAIVIAFCFGALMEALAGFGTPVAISAVMLIALGFQPIKAAMLALVANTAPVAFGALATPIVTLSKVTTPAQLRPGHRRPLHRGPPRCPGRAPDPGARGLRPARAGRDRRRQARRTAVAGCRPWWAVSRSLSRSG